MSWASTRRTLILSILFGAIALLAAVTLIATLYETPSCGDGKQNQDEEGIDCGGVCEQVCTLSAIPPSVVFVRDVPGPGGRTDVIAYIENKNPDSAARSISYTLELYGESRTLLADMKGTMDLLPGIGVPFYIPNVYAGDMPVADVFMTFDESASPWYRFSGVRAAPRVEDVQLVGTEATPRVTAVIRNAEADPFRGLKVIATVFNEENNAIAASQTVISELPGQGSVTVTFTWSTPFTDGVSRIDVRPVLPLPETSLP